MLIASSNFHCVYIIFILGMLHQLCMTIRYNPYVSYWALVDPPPQFMEPPLTGCSSQTEGLVALNWEFRAVWSLTFRITFTVHALTSPFETLFNMNINTVKVYIWQKMNEVQLHCVFWLKVVVFICKRRFYNLLSFMTKWEKSETHDITQTGDLVLQSSTCTRTSYHRRIYTTI